MILIIVTLLLDQLDTVKTQIESALATKTSQSDLITMQNTMTTQIQTSIQTALNNFKLELQKAIIQCRNEQIRGRIGHKSMKIPKTMKTHITLLTCSEINVKNLQYVIITGVCIRRWDRYHNAKSHLVASRFTQLKFFLSADFKKYETYFVTYPSRHAFFIFFQNQ